MKSAGVVVHPSSAEAARAAERFSAAAGSAGLEVVEAGPGASVEIVVSFGGDGTILRGAGIAAGLGVPLLGINVGRLGFLSAAGAAEAERAAALLAAGSFTLEPRMMLVAEAAGESGPVRARALNEVVLEKPAPSRVVRVRVAVGQEEVATYTADGFIVATPTGSTAYSLSAGGPVLEPGMHAIVLTPVSPHEPMWRSIVVGPERPVTMAALDGPSALSADGRTVAMLPPGAAVVVGPDPEPLRIVRFEGPGFFPRLRTRFVPTREGKT